MKIVLIRPVGSMDAHVVNMSKGAVGGFPFQFRRKNKSKHRSGKTGQATMEQMNGKLASKVFIV